MPAAGSSVASAAGGASLQAAGAEGGAHTDGPDGHLLELGRLEVQEAALREADANKGGLDMGMNMDMDLDGEAGAGAPTAMDTNMDDTETHVEKKREQEIDDLDGIPNTVDFALREREEMRDGSWRQPRQQRADMCQRVLRQLLVCGPDAQVH